MDPGFNKIDINIIEDKRIINNQSVKEKKTMKKPFFKSPKIKIIFGIIFLLFLAFCLPLLFLIQPVKDSYIQVKIANDKVKIAVDLIKKQDVVNGNERLKEAKTAINNIQKNLSNVAWFSKFPFFGTYYQDAVSGIKASILAIEAGQTILEAIIPHADILGLKGQGSFVLGSAEERIQKTVQTLDKITPKIGEVENKLKLIRREIDQINVDNYPEFIVGKKMKNQIQTVKSLIDQATVSVAQAKPLLETLPSLLGQPNERKYLILFQNDKELRSTGGFITAFAVFRLEQGRIYAESSEDIYKLDESKTRNFPAPTPILKYFPLVYNWNLRDTNISPDFKTSMRNFEAIYASVPSKIKYDGIIAIDTHVLLKIMEVLGPIELYGSQFTTDIVPECNCPSVIYELEKYADQPVGYARGSRKDLIGQLMYAIMKKSLSSSPKLYWGKLFQVGIQELNQKHILLYFKDEKSQMGVESLNFGGRIKEFNGDYLHINDTNFAGAKSNMYVQHEVKQEVNKDNDGKITKTITIKYKNPEPASNCNLEKGELCLNGLLRNWIRLYVPKGSQLLESKGSEVKITSYEDLGKTVFDGFITVRPQGQATIVFKYTLPFLVKNEVLPLYIQKQPGTVGHKYQIDSGKGVNEFELISDKEVDIKL